MNKWAEDTSSDETVDTEHSDTSCDGNKSNASHSNEDGDADMIAMPVVPKVE